MHYDHRASMVRGLVLEIMVHAAAGQMISLSNAARLPVDDQDLPHMPMFMYRSACSSGAGFLADHGSAWFSERAKRRLGARGPLGAGLTYGAHISHSVRGPRPAWKV